MATKRRIQIENCGDEFLITISESDPLFRAKSILIEDSPHQPGKIIWLYRCTYSLIYNEWRGEKALASYYVGPDEESVPGEALLEYIKDRGRELKSN